MSLLESLRRIQRDLDTTGTDVRERYGVSKPRQLAEMLYYYRKTRAGREEYYGFELYHPERSRSEKLKFLTLAQWRDLTAGLNKRSARGLVFRKSVFGAILRGSDIPTPPEVGLLEVPARLPFEEWRKREDRTIRGIFDAAANGGVVIKPDSQEWGLGILVFTGVQSDSLVHTTGDVYGLQRIHDALRRVAGRFVVQQRVIAHDSLRAFNSVALPTIRVVTCLENGEPWIPRVAFKLPVGVAGVDNYHAGGFACPVDPVTGVVGPGIRKDGFDRISVHPESGVRFEGITLPFWPEVIALVNRAAPFFADLRTLGWDVAISSSGPMIVEANYFWGVDIVQRPHAQGLNQGRFKAWYEKELRKRQHGA